MFWKTIIIGEQERAVVARNGRFKGIFLPGRYRIFAAPGVSLEVEKHSVRDIVFRSKWADYLAGERPEVAERYFTRVETNDVQVAMVYLNGELFSVLTPAKRMLYWRGPAEVRVEIVEVITEPELEDEVLRTFERVIEHQCV